MGWKEVTDPALLAQLNGDDSSSSDGGWTEVTDPTLLAQLDGTPNTVSGMSSGPVNARGRHGTSATEENLSNRAQRAFARGVPRDQVETSLIDALRQRSFKVNGEAPTGDVNDQGITSLFDVMHARAGSRARGGHGREEHVGGQKDAAGEWHDDAWWAAQNDIPSSPLLPLERVTHQLNSGMESTLGGILQLIGEMGHKVTAPATAQVDQGLQTLGFDNPLNLIEQAFADKGKEIVAMGTEDSASAMNGMHRPVSLADAFAHPLNAVEYHGLGAVQSAPAMAAALLTANPELAMGTMGATSGASQYGQDRAAGATVEQSGKDAAMNGVIEALLEGVPMEKVFAKWGEKPVREALGYLATETASEAATGGLQSVASDVALDKPVDLQEAMRQAADSAVQGGLVAGGPATIKAGSAMADTTASTPELDKRLGTNRERIIDMLGEQLGLKPPGGPWDPQVKARLRPDGNGGWTATQPSQAPPQPAQAPAAAQAPDEGSAPAPAGPQGAPVAPSLEPNIPALPALEPGVTRDQLIQEHAAARSDDERAAAAARIAAFEQRHQEQGSVEAKGQEGPHQEAGQEGQGGGEGSAAGHAGEASTGRQGQAVAGDRMALESPIGLAAQAGVARVKDAPRLVVHQNLDTIPDNARAQIGPDETVKGFYDEPTDTIHMVASDINDAADAEWTVDHEIGHALLRSHARRQASGLSGVLATADQNPTVRAIVDAMMKPREDGTAMRPESRSQLREEAVVELLTAHARGGWDEIAKTYGVTVPHNMRKGADTMLRRVIEAIRKAWSKITGKNTFTDADVHELLKTVNNERQMQRTNSKQESDNGLRNRTAADHPAADGGRRGRSADSSAGTGSDGSDGTGTARTEPGRAPVGGAESGAPAAGDGSAHADRGAGGREPVRGDGPAGDGTDRAPAQDSGGGDAAHARRASEAPHLNQRGFVGGVRVNPDTGERVPASEFKRRPDESFDEWEKRVLELQRNTTVFSRAKTRGGLLRDLTEAEQRKVTEKVAVKVLAQLKALPSTDEMAAAALAGSAKRGWYAQSAQTISDVFGPDAPRFAMLLAAMSPQTSVETNLTNALNTWKNWIAAGRPEDADAIRAIMGRSVEGSKGEGSVLPAWVNNSVRALTSVDAATTIMSGPKVNSFFQNLIGNVEEVTNDAWMASFANVNQTIFKGGLTASGLDSGKGTGYLAMNAQIRRTARQLSEMTGETWTPAEVQETIWSWAKTLYEMADAAGENRSMEQLVVDQELTDELIASTPDFGTLFTDPKYAAILKEAGYGKELEGLAGGNAAREAGKESGTRLKAGASAEAVERNLRKSARRLDQVRAARRAADAELTEVPFSRTSRGKNVYGPVQGEDLKGAPVVVNIPGRGKMEFHGFEPAQKIAETFASRHGNTLPTEYVPVDPARGARIAQAYEDMKHDPDNVWVKRAYQAMIDETIQQYKAMLDTGLVVEFIGEDAHHHGDGTGVDPYAATPRLAILDVVENNHLWVFPTTSGFGDNNGADPFPGNPLLAPTEFTISGKPAVANDIFRAVHDYFGHIANGTGFRADGEDNAWREHVRMYSPLAAQAMTTETRGQNSWVNFGPHGEANRTASSPETHFADQKTGLLPKWTMDESATAAPEEGSAPVFSRSFNAKPIQPDAVAVNAIHYSNTPNLTALDPKKAGSGAAGGERRRFGTGVFGKQGGTASRVAFYVHEDGATAPPAENIVSASGGVHPYAVRLTNLYDLDADAHDLASRNMDATEEAISEAGYDGFVTSKQAGIDSRVAVVFDIGGKKIPVVHAESEVAFQRVFHGTPHTVDKFSLQKIGTGEGAQAFGWGLYFAGRKELADWYRNTLSDPGPLLLDGEPLTAGFFERVKEKYGEVPAIFVEYADNNGLSDAHNLINSYLHSHLDSRKYFGDAAVVNATREQLESAQEVLRKLKRSSTGKTYAVDIPNNNELLDYDSPVREQPKRVQDSIRAALNDIVSAEMDEILGRFNAGSIDELMQDMNGLEVYKILERAARDDGLVQPHPDLTDRAVTAPEQASHHLYTHGIPGLYFMDRASRSDQRSRSAIRADIAHTEVQLAKAERQLESALKDDNDATGGYARRVAGERQRIEQLNKELKDRDDATNNYVIWDEGKISEPEIVFSRGVPLPPPSGVVPLSHRLDQLREKLQDRMLRLRRAQEHVGPISDAMDAYNLENMMYGAAKDQLDAVDRDYIKVLQKRLKASGLSTDQLQDYLLARHAPERNAKVASVNPAMPDAGSGITTAEAQGILAGTVAGPYSGKKLTPDDITKAQAVARLVDGMTAQTIATLEASQQITPALAATLRATYKHYVPLVGSDSEPDWVDNFSGTGKGLSVGGSGIKRALGRGKGNIAFNILGEVASRLQRAIVQGEKAKVTQAFLEFALAHPMPDLFTVAPVDMEWKFSQATGQAYLGVKSAFGDNDRSIVVPKNGKFVRIRFEDERLRDAILHMSVNDLSGFVKYAGSINRWRSAVLTRFNPAFTPINVLRDLQFGMTAILSEHGAKIGAQSMANYTPALAALWRDARKPVGDASVPDAQKTIDDWTREYSSIGVKTGLTQVHDVVDLQRRMAVGAMTVMQLAADGKPFTAVREGVTRALDPVLHTIELVNDVTENALRLSVYIALRKSGWSQLRAGAYAKNVTINFNRKGAWGPVIGSIYLFYNASMQGSHAVARVLRKPAVIATLVGLAGLQAMLAASMQGDDDDDGVTEWDTIPDYVKRTSLVIPLSTLTGKKGDYYALPMPYGFNVFPYAGGRITQWVKQGARETDNSLFMDLLKSNTESFSPVPLFEGYEAMFGDTLGSLMQLAANRDDLGRPITAENPYSTYDVPKALQGKPDTPRAYQVTSQIMAKVGGGDLDKRIAPVGFLDASPEQLEYMANFMGGGLTSLVNKSTRWWEMFDADILGSPMEAIGATPIAGRMLGSGNEARAVADRYYAERGIFNRELDRLKERVRGGQDPEKSMADAQAEVPALKGVELDRYKKSRHTADQDFEAGQVKLSETGAPKLRAEADSPFMSLKEAERSGEEINRAIRTVRAPGTTVGDIYTLVDTQVADQVTLTTLGLEPGYNAQAVAPERVRQRAIKALQLERESSQKKFLQTLQRARSP